MNLSSYDKFEEESNGLVHAKLLAEEKGEVSVVEKREMPVRRDPCLMP